MLQLGEKIRLLRQEKGWTQEKLVAGIVKKSMLSQIESGKASPSIELLWQIAERLEVSVGELLKDVNWERKTSELLKLANLLFDKQEYDSALHYFQLYRLEAKESEEDPEQLWKLAICLTETGDYEQSLVVAEKLRKVAITLGEAYWRYQALVQIGQIYFKQSNKKLAQHYWLKAKDRMEAVENLPADQKWSLYNRIGVAYFYLGDHENAVEFYMKALNWLDHTLHFTQQSITLMNLAISLKHLGDYERAEEMYQRLREVKGEIEPLIHALILFHYAIFLSVVGRFEEALKLFEEVRARFIELQEERRVEMVDSEMADVYRRQGNNEIAYEICVRLIDSIQPDHPEYGYVHRTIGLIHMDQAQYDQAIPYLTTAIQQFEQQGRIGYVKVVTEYLADCLQKKEPSGS